MRFRSAARPPLRSVAPVYCLDSNKQSDNAPPQGGVIAMAHSLAPSIVPVLGVEVGGPLPVPHVPPIKKCLRHHEHDSDSRWSLKLKATMAVPPSANAILVLVFNSRSG